MFPAISLRERSPAGQAGRQTTDRAAREAFPLRRKGASRFGKRGTASVELAVCLPIIFTLVFGSIVTSNAVFLKQALTTAAFEAGNVCATDGNTSATAISRAQSILNNLNVKNATVTISPTVTSTTATGTLITVNCSAPLSANSMMYGGIIGSRTISATVTIPHF